MTAHSKFNKRLFDGSLEGFHDASRGRVAGTPDGVNPLDSHDPSGLTNGFDDYLKFQDDINKRQHDTTKSYIGGQFARVLLICITTLIIMSMLSYNMNTWLYTIFVSGK